MRLVLLCVFAATVGCVYGPVGDGPVPCLGVHTPSDPISRGLAYLDATQVRDGGARDAEDAGDWPQWMEIGHPLMAGTKACEVSPFAAAAVHLALSRITPRNAASIGLPPADAERARRLRRAVIPFLARFEVERADVPEGSFGFWPVRDRVARGPFDGVLQLGMLASFVGPRPCGPLAPRYGPCPPLAFGLWPDLDTTAFVQLAQWNDALLDGGAARSGGGATPYLAARDLDRDRAPARRNALSGPTGAYRVWLQPECAPERNELDVIVGAHALLALARQGKQDTPGFRETGSWVREAVEARIDREPRGASDYYPDGFVLHAEVARAAADGPVPGLASVARLLADEVEEAAQRAEGGDVFWDGPDDPYPTCLAVAALLFAGRRGPLVDGGVRHLLRAQDAKTGGWPVATICVGVAESGVRFRWRSSAVPTALALEVLVMQRLAAGLGR